MLTGNEYFYSYSILFLTIVQGIVVGVIIARVLMNGQEQRIKRLEEWRDGRLGHLKQSNQNRKKNKKHPAPGLVP
jgi:MFS superfamily sulfate permease-like transporter